MLADAAACARALVPTRTLAHAHVGTRGLPDSYTPPASTRRSLLCGAMWLIVQYPGVLHAVADKASLNELSQQYGIHRGNLRSS